MKILLISILLSGCVTLPVPNEVLDYCEGGLHIYQRHRVICYPGPDARQK
jgi:hypothetical protein